MPEPKQQSPSARENGFEPKIVAFFCNWCTYLAADLAGTSRVKYAPNIRVIRTMCSGRIDPQFVLDAFARGADGVLIGGCHPGDCHYQEGNYKTLRRVHLLRCVLREMGIEDERFRLEWISASEAERLKTVVNEMVEKIRALGPRNAKSGVRSPGSGVETRHSIIEIRNPPPAEVSEFRLSNFEFSPGTPDTGLTQGDTTTSDGTISENGKPKVAFYWCASCGGCEEAVLDLDERVLDLVKAVEIVFWPVALDFKRRQIEAMDDGSLLVAFVNGAIRTTEQQEMAHLLRRKARIVVAFGACAQSGGIPGLANLSSRDAVLACAYGESPSTVNAQKVYPRTQYRENGFSVTLPELFEAVHSLDQIVEVDYYLPGCPPTPKILWEAVQVLLGGNLPPKGSVLAPDRALCHECPRLETRPEKLTLKGFKRPQDVMIDEQRCLLAQGVVCLGAATRAGCEALCPHGNMPCTGCFGPTSRVRDYGAKALSAVASIVDSNDEAEIKNIVQTVPDPVGTFYRYSLPASLLQRKTQR